MEQKKTKSLLDGVFGFDRGGALHVLSCLAAAVAIVLVVVNQITPFDNAWIWIIVAAGVTVLFNIIALIGKAVVHGRRLHVYEDGVEYVASKKKAFILPLGEIFMAEAQGNTLILHSKKDGIVRGLTNAKNVADFVEALLHPTKPKELSGPDLIYVNIAMEELRKAKELFDCGMITKEDYLGKKQKYVEAVANFYLIRPGEATRRVK